jgi:hypothetical protein
LALKQGGCIWSVFVGAERAECFSARYLRLPPETQPLLTAAATMFGGLEGGEVRVSGAIAVATAMANYEMALIAATESCVEADDGRSAADCVALAECAPAEVPPPANRPPASRPPASRPPASRPPASRLINRGGRPPCLFTGRLARVACQAKISAEESAGNSLDQRGHFAASMCTVAHADCHHARRCARDYTWSEQQALLDCITTGN